jgi:hypothetical protein
LVTLFEDAESRERGSGIPALASLKRLFTVKKLVRVDPRQIDRF